MIRPIILTLLASCAVGSTFVTTHDPLLVWNASASVPIGLYFVQPRGKLAVTDLVVARPPEELQSWLVERRYLAHGVLLIKRVAALPGQRICRNGRAVTVDSIDMAEAQNATTPGDRCLLGAAAMPCFRAKSFSSIGMNHPRSTDATSTIPSENLIGHAVPLRTWE